MSGVDSVGRCRTVCARERSGTRAKLSFGDMRSQAGVWDRGTPFHSTPSAYCCFPFVSIMNAVSRFSSSSRKSLSLNPRSMMAEGIEL